MKTLDQQVRDDLVRLDQLSSVPDHLSRFEKLLNEKLIEYDADENIPDEVLITLYDVVVDKIKERQNQTLMDRLRFGRESSEEKNINDHFIRIHQAMQKKKPQQFLKQRSYGKARSDLMDLASHQQERDVLFVQQGNEIADLLNKQRQTSHLLKEKEKYLSENQARQRTLEDRLVDQDTQHVENSDELNDTIKALQFSLSQALRQETILKERLSRLRNIETAGETKNREIRDIRSELQSAKTQAQILQLEIAGKDSASAKKARDEIVRKERLIQQRNDRLDQFRGQSRQLQLEKETLTDQLKCSAANSIELNKEIHQLKNSLSHMRGAKATIVKTKESFSRDFSNAFLRLYREAMAYLPQNNEQLLQLLSEGENLTRALTDSGANNQSIQKFLVSLAQGAGGWVMDQATAKKQQFYNNVIQLAENADNMRKVAEALGIKIFDVFSEIIPNLDLTREREFAEHLVERIAKRNAMLDCFSCNPDIKAEDHLFLEFMRMLIEGKEKVNKASYDALMFQTGFRVVRGRHIEHYAVPSKLSHNEATGERCEIIIPYAITRLLNWRILVGSRLCK